MRNDETIALNALMFAERWRLQPWLDIRWSEEEEAYSTFIMSSSYDSTGDILEEDEYEIKSLEDLNLVLATDAEFYDKVTTLVSIGALEAHDIEIESLIRVITDRLMGITSDVPYLYSMKQSDFTVDEDRVYKFDDLEEETGLLALDAIKVLSRTGDWWGETLEIRHVKTEWSDLLQEYIPSNERYFEVSVAMNNVYLGFFRKRVAVTEENFHWLLSSVEDVTCAEESEDFSEPGITRNYLASLLFCERAEKDRDAIIPSAFRKLPASIVKLLPSSRRM